MDTTISQGRPRRKPPPIVFLCSKFRYLRREGARQYEVTLPEGAEGRLLLPSGKEISFTGRVCCEDA